MQPLSSPRTPPQRDYPRFPVANRPAPSPMATPSLAATDRGGEGSQRLGLSAAPRNRPASSSARNTSSTACSSRSSPTATSCSKAFPASPRRSPCVRWPRRCRSASSASSSRPTCFRRTSSARRFTIPRDGTFNPKPGPIFANFVLADEINRAPAKVQSALLEAMQERQVTLGENTYALPEPFLVMATQNPDRAGRHLSPARGAGRPLHAQDRRDLSHARRGTRHP